MLYIFIYVVYQKPRLICFQVLFCFVIYMLEVSMPNTLILYTFCYAVNLKKRQTRITSDAYASQTRIKIDIIHVHLLSSSSNFNFSLSRPQVLWSFPHFRIEWHILAHIRCSILKPRWDARMINIQTEAWVKNSTRIVTQG